MSTLKMLERGQVFCLQAYRYIYAELQNHERQADKLLERMKLCCLSDFMPKQKIMSSQIKATGEVPSFYQWEIPTIPKTT